MPKVLYHQDPQAVILDLVDHEIKEKDSEGKEKVIRKTKALVDAAGNVVVTDPKEGTEFGYYSTDSDAVKSAEAKAKADADKKAAEEAAAKAKK